MLEKQALDIIEQAWQVKNMLNTPLLQAVCGFHIYHRLRTPWLGQHLHREREHGNTEDQFAVAVVKKCVGDTDARTVVGYLPREVRQDLWYFLGHGGEIRAVGSFPGVGRLIDQSGDAAEGREIEARSADHIPCFARKK